MDVNGIKRMRLQWLCNPCRWLLHLQRNCQTASWFQSLFFPWDCEPLWTPRMPGHQVTSKPTQPPKDVKATRGVGIGRIAVAMVCWSVFVSWRCWWYQIMVGLIILDDAEIQWKKVLNKAILQTAKQVARELHSIFAASIYFQGQKPLMVCSLSAGVRSQLDWSIYHS